MWLHGAETQIEYEGKEYPLDLSYDNVLNVFALQKDWLFDPVERLALSVEMLAGKDAARLEVQKQAELLKKIFPERIDGKGLRGSGAGAYASAAGAGPKVFDFEQDAGLIYAGFLQAYGIDLLDVRGVLGWREFMTLFNALPDGTKFREVVEIRQRPEPAPTKYNQKEIAALRKAKQYYALDVDMEDAERTFQRDLDRLVKNLEGRVKRRGR